MEDLLSLALYVLFGIVGIFIIVSIAKAASRTVDTERRGSGASGQTQKGAMFCVHCGKPVWDTDVFCTHCGIGHGQTPILIAPAVKEIRLGMTPAEVEAALGAPETKADLGEKALYKYKNMTVEFHDGKVTDVR